MKWFLFFESIPNLLPENKTDCSFHYTRWAAYFWQYPAYITRGCLSPLSTTRTMRIKRFIRRHFASNHFCEKWNGLCLKETVILSIPNLHSNHLWKPVFFRSLVQKVKEYIRAGDVIQTVISMPFLCTPPPDLWALYRAQRFINPSPYLYFLSLDEMTLVGSSLGNHGKAGKRRRPPFRPIAGTRPRGEKRAGRQVSGQWASCGWKKNGRNTLCWFDLGRNDLGRVAEVGTVQVTDLMIVERYSHVMHLVSNICCDLKSEYDCLGFASGHLSCRNIIRSSQNKGHGDYRRTGKKDPGALNGGAVGYISFHGNMDMAITIRTASIENGLTDGFRQAPESLPIPIRNGNG